MQSDSAPFSANAAREAHARPRAGWRETSRVRAFLTHLAISAGIVGTACALIFFVWYPHPYFQAVGAWRVLRVLVGVDLVLGPLLTLIVFKPGKRGLAFDVTVIALVQLSALVYGLDVIYRERPYYTVFAVDRFYVLAQRDVDSADAVRRIGAKPWRGPLLAVAARPDDPAAMQRLLDETVFQGKPDIERRPEFWRRYDDRRADVLARARPLAVLRAARPERHARIDALTAALGLPEDRLAFVPLIGKNRDLAFVVDKADGSPLEVLDVDPWIADADLGAAGAAGRDPSPDDTRGAR